MKITPCMMRVMRAVEQFEDCGARTIDEAMWPDRHCYKPLRAGQYAGRLVQLGLLRKRYEEHHSLRDRTRVVAMTVEYRLSDLARDILRSER
jgi:hypothetical protein